MRKGLIASVAATGATVVMLGAAWAQTPSGNPYNWSHHMMWWGGYGMFFGPLFMIVILAVLIGAVFFFFRGPGVMQSRSTPLDILKERYARGEIEKAEFDERRHTLGV